MSISSILFKIIKDIRFWLLISVILRGERLMDAPLDDHGWRQALTISTAKNFLEIDNNILYPRIDIAGEKTGIIGSEFPFMNYILYILYLIFGYQACSRQ